MRPHVIIVSVAILLCAWLNQSRAEVEEPLPCPVCDRAEAEPYRTHWYGKLGRGLLNTALGWTELFAQPVKAHHAKETLITGIDRGVGYTFKRTIEGVGEALTCWVGPWHATWAESCVLGVWGKTSR